MIQKFIHKIVPVLYLLGSCGTTTTAQENRFEKKFHMESASTVLAIGDKINKGKTVSEAEWDELFETNGYAKYLNHRNRERVSTYLREALLLAFDRQNTAETDSLLQLSAEEPDIELILKQNICRLAQQREKAKTFLTETDFAALLEQADKKAQTFLPRRAMRQKTVLNDLYLICTIPDASVRNHAVFLDLTCALSMTEAELVNLLAHEFFHNYRETTYKDNSRDSFVKVFNLFQNEGIADLIDKEEGKEKKGYAVYGEKWMEMYEQAYRNTPETLAKIDSLVNVYEAGPAKEDLTAGGEYIPLADLVVLNGHPAGFYMTNLIRKAGLFRPLLRNFDNPIKFIRLYNRAAQKHNRTSPSQEYVFSKRLIKHLKRQESKH